MLKCIAYDPGDCMMTWLLQQLTTVCDAEFEACITFEFKFGADWIGRGHLSFFVLHFAIGKRNGQTGYILCMKEWYYTALVSLPLENRPKNIHPAKVLKKKSFSLPCMMPLVSTLHLCYRWQYQHPGALGLFPLRTLKSLCPQRHPPVWSRSHWRGWSVSRMGVERRMEGGR